jgi:putative monooxygenase
MANLDKALISGDHTIMHLGLPTRPPESILANDSDPLEDFLPSVALRVQISHKCHAQGLCTGTATFLPGAQLPYHTHTFSEVVTVLSGEARVSICGRSYLLGPYDSVHIPRATAHKVVNPGEAELVAHWAFASGTPTREMVGDSFPDVPREGNYPAPGDPESIRRFADAEVYALSEGAFFRDLFAKRFGSDGICGGYGLFQPGASLPCHVHQFDESITIVQGQAVCLVEGRQYQLSDNAAAFVPEGRAHRFINRSTEPMAMIWVYAGSEPERKLVDAGYCSGELPWS